MSLVSVLVQSVVTLVIVMLAMAVAETMRRRGFDPIGRLAGFLSQRDAAGLPVAGGS